MPGLAYIFLWIFAALFCFFLLLIFFVVYNESSRAGKDLLAKRACWTIAALVMISIPFVTAKYLYTSHSELTNPGIEENLVPNIPASIDALAALEELQKIRSAEMKNAIETAYNVCLILALMSSKLIFNLHRSK